jgi:hypothetical protein
MLPTKLWFICPSGFSAEDFFRNQPIRNKTLLWWPCLWPHGQMKRNLVGSIYGRPSIKIAHFVPIRHKHGCHRQFLFLIGQFLKKSLLLKPFDQININYQVSFHLAMRFQRRFFRNRPIRNRRWTTDAKWWQKLTLPK